jgi:hypothetical protein
MTMLLEIAMIAIVMLIARCGWLDLSFFVGVVKFFVDCFVSMINMMAAMVLL